MEKEEFVQRAPRRGPRSWIAGAVGRVKQALSSTSPSSLTVNAKAPAVEKDSELTLINAVVIYITGGYKELVRSKRKPYTWTTTPQFVDMWRQVEALAQPLVDAEIQKRKSGQRVVRLPRLEVHRYQQEVLSDPVLACLASVDECNPQEPFTQALLAMRDGRYEEVIALCTQALEADTPETPVIRLARATFLRLYGKVEDANAEYRLLMEDTSALYPLVRLTAHLHRIGGKEDGHRHPHAVKRLDGLVSQFPDQPDLAFQRASADVQHTSIAHEYHHPEFDTQRTLDNLAGFERLQWMPRGCSRRQAEMMIRVSEYRHALLRQRTPRFLFRSAYTIVRIWRVFYRMNLRRLRRQLCRARSVHGCMYLAYEEYMFGSASKMIRLLETADLSRESDPVQLVLWYCARGRAEYLKTRQLRDAVPFFEQALALDSTCGPALHFIQWHLIEQGELKLADAIQDQLLCFPQTTQSVTNVCTQYVKARALFAAHRLLNTTPDLYSLDGDMLFCCVFRRKLRGYYQIRCLMTSGCHEMEAARSQTNVDFTT